MRILVVTHWYAPAVHPRAFRWSALAAHWAARGHDVDVLCRRRPGEEAEELLDGVKVHRAAGGWLENLRARRGGPAPAGGEAGRPHPLKLLNDLAWRRIRWPDYACLWYRSAARLGRKIVREKGCDLLITTSDPFTDHLVGLAVKKASPGLRWIVDVGDPFSLQEATPVNNHLLFRRLNRRAEGRVLAAAEAVTVTAPVLMEMYAEAFPAVAGKLRLAPPMLPKEIKDAGREKVFPADGKIRLVVVGTLYRKVRHPGALLDLFERLRRTDIGERLELHFFGNVNDCADLFEPRDAHPGRGIFLHGVVPREIAIAAMKEAALLVNIGNAVAYQLPSKVVEYAAAGRPVLNLAVIEDDSSARFLKDYPAFLNLTGAEAAGEGAASRVRGFILNPPAVDDARLQSWLAPFSVERLAAAYEKWGHS